MNDMNLTEAAKAAGTLVRQFRAFSILEKSLQELVQLENYQQELADTISAQGDTVKELRDLQTALEAKRASLSEACAQEKQSHEDFKARAQQERETLLEKATETAAVLIADAEKAVDCLLADASDVADAAEEVRVEKETEIRVLVDQQDVIRAETTALLSDLAAIKQKFLG